MGSPHRKRKDYLMRGVSVETAVANLPPAYEFAIDGQLVDFGKFKLLEDKSKDIAWGFAIVAWRRRNDISGPTANSHMYYLGRFFEYLQSEIGSVSLQDLNQAVVNHFAYWIKNIAIKNSNNTQPVSETTRRRIWGTVRDYLNDLMRYGFIDADIDLPTHQFDSSETETFKPYSKNQVLRIVNSCHEDISKILRGEEIATGHARSAYLARLIPHALLISLRTGLNPEVLFDIEVQEYSLKPSHLLNSTLLILPVKKRSGRSQNVELSEELVDGLRVKNQVAKLIEEVEKLTKNARDSLPLNDPLRRKLWLVANDEGDVDVFKKFNYYLSLQAFAHRHSICDHTGETTEINFRRFRPTFAEAMLKLNGGDVRDLQKRLGHSHIRTTMGYLDPNLEERKEAFHYAGKIMVDWALSGSDIPSTKEIASQLNVSLDSAKKLQTGDFNMGVAKCKNPFDSPLEGATKGDLCTNYLACFRCGNCVVLKEDSHRLFSFYYWLLGKKVALGNEKWSTTYGWIIEIIDRDIAPQLGDATWIETEKTKAKLDPLPMWLDADSKFAEIKS